MTNPLRDWRIDPTEVVWVGHDLQRPECILAERDGTTDGLLERLAQA